MLRTMYVNLTGIMQHFNTSSYYICTAYTSNILHLILQRKNLCSFKYCQRSTHQKHHGMSSTHILLLLLRLRIWRFWLELLPSLESHRNLPAVPARPHHTLESPGKEKEKQRATLDHSACLIFGHQRHTHRLRCTRAWGVVWAEAPSLAWACQQ